MKKLNINNHAGGGGSKKTLDANNRQTTKKAFGRTSNRSQGKNKVANPTEPTAERGKAKFVQAWERDKAKTTHPSTQKKEKKKKAQINGVEWEGMPETSKQQLGAKRNEEVTTEGRKGKKKRYRRGGTSSQHKDL